MTLSDIFDSGASNIDPNLRTVVDVVLTTNHNVPPLNSPYASFAQWGDQNNSPKGSGLPLVYTPRQGSGIYAPPPYFSGSPAQAYFSDRTNADGSPFNPSETDELALTITEVDPTIISLGGGPSGPFYAANFGGYGRSWTVVLNTDPATGVSYGSVSGIFFVFGFANLRKVSGTVVRDLITGVRDQQSKAVRGQAARSSSRATRK